MKTKTELEDLVSRIYWAMEHGQLNEAHRLLDQLQREAYEEGKKSNAAESGN